MNPNSTLTLYHLSYCPFCHKVRRAADALGIELELIEIRENPAARDYLLKERNSGTVPVLGIPTADGETLLGESDDIVAYLHRNAALLRKAA